ncbi:MAG: GNAT family N-acetyltransferase [Clostridia bacterium]|nr:GNAT family N-acetyltransferase [Clostridia bacterium]
MNHDIHIQKCYELAIAAGKKGFDTFGALLVHDGRVIETAENNADYEHGFFGHAEFNLVHQCANKYSDEVLRQSTLYTSCAPCERCLASIASLGIRRVVYGVSYKAFSQLTPFDDVPLDREGLLAQLHLPMQLEGPVLEDEGMHVFEYWGGEHRPLAELIAEMAPLRRQNRIRSLDYVDLFHHTHPDFFAQPHIRALPSEYIFDEQVLLLADFDPNALDIPVPAYITYGLYTGDHTTLLAAVRDVDEEWAQWFQPDSRTFVAMDGDKVVSFCLLDDFGEYQGLRIGAPGCVGTVPAYRKQGIGLRMIQLATQMLKDDGYDLSWIHYTHVGHWYARLGYQTVVRWNSRGIVGNESSAPA